MHMVDVLLAIDTDTKKSYSMCDYPRRVWVNVTQDKTKKVTVKHWIFSCLIALDRRQILSWPEYCHGLWMPNLFDVAFSFVIYIRKFRWHSLNLFCGDLNECLRLFNIVLYDLLSCVVLSRFLPLSRSFCFRVCMFVQSQNNKVIYAKLSSPQSFTVTVQWR